MSGWITVDTTLGFGRVTPVIDVERGVEIPANNNTRLITIQALMI